MVTRDMTNQVYIPDGWSPLVDEPDRLMILADWFGERGDTYMARLCRWTSNEWLWGRGLPRKSCEPEMEVWARFGRLGWSRAVIDTVGPRQISVRFPHRHRDGSGGYRAWWDLIPRIKGKKPKPRKGYGVTANASFAAALMGSPRSRIIGDQVAEAREDRDGRQRLLFNVEFAG